MMGQCWSTLTTDNIHFGWKSKFLHCETLHAFRFQTHSSNQLSHSQLKEQKTTTIQRHVGPQFSLFKRFYQKFIVYQRLLIIDNQIPFQQGKAESFEWSGIFVNFTILRNCNITLQIICLSLWNNRWLNFNDRKLTSKFISTINWKNSNTLI